MSSDWKKLEHHVRALASLRWNAKCLPEHIDGVDFDGVVRVSDDEIILIEITRDNTLEKVRNLINRLAPTRLNFLTKGLICRCFIVLSSEPTNSMAEAGKSAHIAVCSSATFEREYFDFNSYNTLRKELSFGSAIDSKTGENDKRAFISVTYEEVGTSRKFGLDDIVNRIMRGSKIALTGDFGVGKSRCVREVYCRLSKRTRDAGGFPIAINLKDHWSSSNALEILAGHLGNVGLANSIDNVVRLLNSGHLILLLDGFDEIGTQSHDTRIDDRQAVRCRAVRGVRDLILRSKAGVLVTGRSHFFDSNEEMMQSLGLANNKKTTMHISVPDNFTLDEGQRYLSDLGVDAKLPEWLPRKPLVFQILAELESNEIIRILSREHGDYQFWRTFIDAACTRESKGVGESISPLTIMHILMKLAARTRYSNSFLGRLSPRDIADAYERVVGSAPDETGRQLLARMCTLGRIEPESPDRQFIDYNVVDILRADCLITDVVAMSDVGLQKQWVQTLRTLGVVYAATMVNYFDLLPQFHAYLRKFGGYRNTIKLSEIVSTLTLWGAETIDFESLYLSGGYFPVLDLRGRELRNLLIKDCEINSLLFEGTITSELSGCKIIGCIINQAVGISGKAAIPSWIEDTEVFHFEDLDNAARIKESLIDGRHKLFLVIIHKIFFQPGAGREESSLLKGGYGQKYDSKAVDDILRLLLREKIVSRFKGKDGWVYKPERKHTQRLDRIRSELSLSDDPLWLAVGKL